VVQFVFATEFVWCGWAGDHCCTLNGLEWLVLGFNVWIDHVSFVAFTQIGGSGIVEILGAWGNYSRVVDRGNRFGNECVRIELFNAVQLTKKWILEGVHLEIEVGRLLWSFSSTVEV
jgi:hypothetical protein